MLRNNADARRCSYFELGLPVMRVEEKNLPALGNNFVDILSGLAHATGVHERNTVPYARFALKKRHGFCAKAREKNMQRHRLGTL